jgi:hypothetical protein
LVGISCVWEEAPEKARRIDRLAKVVPAKTIRL